MLLVLECVKNIFYGDRFYFVSIENGFLWDKQNKFIGTREEKQGQSKQDKINNIKPNKIRIYISCENKTDFEKYLNKYKTSFLSSSMIKDIIKNNINQEALKL